MSAEFQKTISAFLIVAGLVTLTWHLRLVHFATDMGELNHEADEKNIKPIIFDSYPEDVDIFIAIEAAISENENTTFSSDFHSENATLPDEADVIYNATMLFDETSATFTLDDLATHAIINTYSGDIPDALNSTLDEGELPIVESGYNETTTHNSTDEIHNSTEDYG